MSWPLVALEELGRINTGSTPSTSNTAFWTDAGTPFVTPGELGTSTPIVLAERNLTHEGRALARVAPRDAVLVCCIGSLGKVGIAGTEVVTNQQINWIDFSRELVHPRYGYYACLTLKTEMVKRAPSTTVPILNKSSFSKLEIPLPPLSEQKRIAAILDKADQLRQKRRQAIALLDSLTQSIFLEIFGDPLSNPKMWPIDHLGKLCDVRDGTHDSPKYVSDGFPLLTSKNFSSGRVDILGAKMISKSDFDQINRRSKVDIGDIVMPMIGTIGSPVIIDSEPNFAIKNVALIKFNERSPTVEYIYALLNSRYLEHALSKVAKGGTQKFLSLGELRKLPVPVPPKDKQFNFTQFLTILKNRKQCSEMSELKLTCLFSSLQHRAFSGQL